MICYLSFELSFEILHLSQHFSQERAIAQGLQSMSMRHYVGKYVTQFPELLDLVAADSSAMEVLCVIISCNFYSDYFPCVVVVIDIIGISITYVHR